MPSQNVRIDGLEELDRKLSRLPAVVARDILGASLEDGAELIRAQAEENAPRKRGNLKDSIVLSDVKRPKRDVAEIKVGIDYTRCRIGHLVEFGTAPRFRFTSGRSGGQYGYTGAVRPNPFMTRAYESKKHEAIRRIQKEIGERVERAARRA